MKGNKTITNLKNKKVLCINTGIEYHSIAEAARKTGIAGGSICAICKGQIKISRKNLKWKYI